MLLQTSCARKLYYSRISGIGNNNKLIFCSEHLILQFITNQEEIKQMKIRSTLNYHVLKILKNPLVRAAIFLTSVQKTGPSALMGYYHTIALLGNKIHSSETPAIRIKFHGRMFGSLRNSLQRTSTVQKLFRRTFFMYFKLLSLFH